MKNPRFTDDAFDPEQAATIGVDFKVKTVKLNNGDKVCARIDFLFKKSEFILNFRFEF